MSAITVEPARRDVRVISLIGIAHGASHYYQLAFVTMLLIVRDSVGLSFEQIGVLGAVFYGVSGFGQTVAGFAVDRFGARPILAGGLAALGLSLGLVSMAHSFWAFAAIAVLGGAGNSVFHPADFAILNASVNQNRLGRAFSIHGLGGSLYALLQTEYDVQPGEAEEHIQIVGAGRDEAKLLDVRRSTPLVAIIRTAWDRDGRPFEHSHDLFRSDRVRIVVRTPAGEQDARGVASTIEVMA